LSQAEVARRGGLSGNNAISRLIVNAKLGPSVANFMKAVHGLGLSLVDFLAGVEESHGATPSLTARVEAIERALAALQRERRRHDTAAATVSLVSPTGDPVASITSLDQAGYDRALQRDELAREVAAIVRAQLDPLFHSLTPDMVATLRALRDVDPDAPGAVSTGRRTLSRPNPPPRPPQIKDLLDEEVS
jgi:hypothetical protein